MKFKTMLGLVIALSLVSLPSNAGPSSGIPVQQLFTNNTLDSVNWRVVVPNLSRGIKGMSLFSSANLPIEVGIAFTNASGNAEVSQLIVPAALSSVGAPGAIFYPLAVGYGARVSIRTKSSTGQTISAGEMDMSLYFN